MADAVTSQTLYDGPKTAIMKFTDISDGVGEAAVLKVDVSALRTLNGQTNGAPCTGVTITKIWSSMDGMSVDILWDASTPLICLSLAAGNHGELDFRDIGGLVNNAGAGKTGDIKFTTIGHAAGDRYSIILEMQKSY